MQSSPIKSAFIDLSFREYFFLSLFSKLNNETIKKVFLKLVVIHKSSKDDFIL